MITGGGWNWKQEEPVETTAAAAVRAPRRNIRSLIIVGLLIPFTYQILLSTFAYLFPLTLVPPAGWIALHVLTDVLFVVCPLLAVRQPLREAWRTIGGRAVPWLDCAIAVIIGLLATYLFELIYNVVAFYFWRTPPDFGFPQSSQDVVPFVLLVAIIGPIGEETLFRGYFGSLFKNPWVFLPVSALVWDALHVDPGYFLPYLVTGLVFGYLRIRFQSLYPSLALHMLLNVTALLMFFFWR